MLDAWLDQGAGLRQHTPRSIPRLTALVGQGDPHTELPLLWQLCSALQVLGYQVAVLDATTEETEQAPGLRELLEGDFFGGDEPAALAAPSGLTVFAAGHALGPATAPVSLERLARAMRPHDIVLLYADASIVAQWVARCRALVPVLAASPAPAGVLAAYRSLKSLIDAGVVPTVASVVTRPGMVTAGAAQAARDNLVRCAAAWLDCRIEVLRVRAVPGSDRGDVHRLALRLLEGAATLDDEPFWGAALEGDRLTATTVRSH